MSNFDLVRAMWLRKARRQRQKKTISGVPPLTFKAGGVALKDYRIYGNSEVVDGEIVSVGERTKNLVSIDNFMQGVVNGVTGGLVESEKTGIVAQEILYLESGTYTLSCDGAENYKVNAVTYDSTGSYIRYNAWLTLPASINVANNNGIRLVIRYVDESEININNISNLQFEKGSTATSYEPYGYKIPITCGGITTNIYLDEPLRKVGDEADYIDFGKQEVIRACGEISRAVSEMNNSENYPGWKYCQELTSFVENDYNWTLSNCITNAPDVPSANTININNPTLFFASSKKTQTQWKNDFPDLVMQIVLLRLMKQSENLTIPALPTIAGTNILAVDTTVKPSRVDIKGKIKKLEGA